MAASLTQLANPPRGPCLVFHRGSPAPERAPPRLELGTRQGLGLPTDSDHWRSPQGQSSALCKTPAGQLHRPSGG